MITQPLSLAEINASLGLPADKQTLTAPEVARVLKKDLRNVYPLLRTGIIRALEGGSKGSHWKVSVHCLYDYMTDPPVCRGDE